MQWHTLHSEELQEITGKRCINLGCFVLFFFFFGDFCKQLFFTSLLFSAQRKDFWTSLLRLKLLSGHFHFMSNTWFITRSHTVLYDSKSQTIW